MSLCLARRDAPVKVFDDLRTRGMTVSASGPGSDGNIYGRVMNAVLKTKLKIIVGYQGSSDTLLAIDRGEVEGSASVSYASVITSKKDWITEKKVTLLAQHALKKHPDLQDVPLILDFAENEEDHRVLELIFSRQTIGYPYVAPPDTPADRVEAIRAAFAQTLADPEVRHDAEAAGVLIDPLGGPEILDILRRVYGSPDAVIARAAAAMAPE